MMFENYSTVHKLTAPNPFCLITSGNHPDKTNISALSWWTHVSNNPPTLCIAVSTKSYTNHLISNSKQFGLCLIDKSLHESGFKCGTSSGRDVDKPIEFNIALKQSEKISCQLIADSRVAFECKVVKDLLVADHTLFISEVVNVHCRPELTHLYAINGYSKLAAIESV